MESNDKDILREFYLEFLDQLDLYEKNLCIIVFNNFHAIEERSFRNGNRQKLLVSLIDKVRDRELVMPERHGEDHDASSIIRLISLTVKSFRGFQEQQDFSFGEKYTFIYGRNGTGKSSLTEAIEYALLGSIQEAKYKRIDLDEYIKNIYTRSAIVPELKGLDSTDNEINVMPNNDQFKFAIIERNRIENFARLSAETASVQQERLAALVGLDSWNKFVANFSKTIDDYLPIENEFQKEIETESSNFTALSGQLTTSQNSVEESRKALSALLKKYKQTDGRALTTFIKEKKQTINEQLRKVRTARQIPTDLVVILRKSQNHFFTELLASRTHIQELTQYKNDLSLADLAEAILKFKEGHPNRCPACLSTIHDDEGKLLVVADPYDHAEKVREKFQNATLLEQQVEKEQKRLYDYANSLEAALRNVFNHVSANHLEFPIRGKDLLQILVEKRDNSSYSSIREDTALTSEELNKLESEISAYNKLQLSKDAEFQKLQNKASELSRDEGTLDSSLKVISGAGEVQNNLKEKIAKTKTKLDDLAIKAKDAQLRNNILRQYALAYKSWLKKIKQYSSRLPISELEDLNRDALTLYNLINKYDFESERPKLLNIPTTSDGVIEISFDVDNAPTVNALDVLSEGHIRTLGLAILLAKALKNHQRFIVFDDVVNAIDDDHRKAIAELITDENGLFSGVQWIVTTHGQQFAKQLSSNLPHSIGTQIREITFKAKGTDTDIQAIERSQNYLNLATDKLANEDVRGCLADCRRELEVLMIKLWKLFYARYGERLSFMIDPSNPIPETKNVLNVLNNRFKKYLERSPSEQALMNPVITRLDKILDDKGIIWYMVNKGTHEEENAEELDRPDTDMLLNQYLIPLDDYLTTGIKVKKGLFQAGDVSVAATLR